MDDEVATRAGYPELQRVMLLGVDARLAALRGLRLLEDERAATEADATQRARWAISSETARQHWNAWTLVHFFAAVEAHVERLGPVMRDVVLTQRQHNEQRLRQAVRVANAQLRQDGAHPEKIKLLTRLTFDAYRRLVPPVPDDRLARLKAADRWEDALRRIWLGAPPGRALPPDLRQTLNEVGEVRNVLLHNMGRVDQRLVDACEGGHPWGQVGLPVTIDQDLYRRYAAALWAYGDELLDRLRLLLDVPAHADINDWRSAVPAGG